MPALIYCLPKNTEEVLALGSVLEETVGDHVARGTRFYLTTDKGWRALNYIILHL